MAQRGKLDVPLLIRREDGEIALPIEHVRVLVTNAEKAPSAGAVAVPDVALLGWPYCDYLVRRFEAETDVAADDKVALSSTQREDAAADVERELLQSPGLRRAWCGAGFTKDCRSSFAESATPWPSSRRVGHAASQARRRHDGRT